LIQTHMDILNDSSFWLSMSSLCFVFAGVAIKQIYKCKISDMSCSGMHIHRDVELEATIDRHLDIIPPPNNSSMDSNSNSLRSVR
jgi:hypothetical protein